MEGSIVLNKSVKLEVVMPNTSVHTDMLSAGISNSAG